MSAAYAIDRRRETAFGPTGIGSSKTVWQVVDAIGVEVGLGFKLKRDAVRAIEYLKTGELTGDELDFEGRFERLQWDKGIF